MLGLHFVCDFSRVELGHSDCSAAPRMGPKEQLVGGAAEQSECWGVKVLQFVFGDVLPRVCGQLLASTVQPAIRVRLSLARLTLCFIRAWSRQASAPNLPASVGPRAKPGARRLPKLSLSKRFLVLLEGRL